jgi:hypothetical protein
MKFICLICAEKVMEDLTETDAENHYQEYVKFTEWLKRAGHFVAANRLKPSATATTVRVRDGKVSRVDGPFAETKEQIGGYYVIEADDLETAVQIAAKIPGAKRGCVEIRSIANDAQTLALGLDSTPPVSKSKPPLRH